MACIHVCRISGLCSAYSAISFLVPTTARGCIFTVGYFLANSCICCEENPYLRYSLPLINFASRPAAFSFSASCSSVVPISRSRLTIDPGMSSRSTGTQYGSTVVWTTISLAVFLTSGSSDFCSSATICSVASCFVMTLSFSPRMAA